MKRKPDTSPAVSPIQGTSAPAASPAKISGVGTKVSIVEDDAEARELLAGWLDSTSHFRCVSAHIDGLAALEELGGRCMVTSRPGGGTSVAFEVELHS